MSKGLQIRNEEYTALGDFIRVSFERDMTLIAARFPKMNETFLNSFIEKLEAIKILESGLMLTEEQKNATKMLYKEVDELNKELNFLSNYCKDAGLNVGVISELKKDLTKGNVEGAILKIEGVKQFVSSNVALLTEEGMDANFATTLEAHKESLATKNALQNSTMNARKTLTKANKDAYKELYGYITKIMRYGKLVFSTDVIKEEYTISRVVSKMRSPKNN